MPANLTFHYHKAEAAYRRAQTLEEELECLQVMLRELPKHKGTDKLQADLKQKISKAREQVLRGQKSGKRSSLRIPRQGAGRAMVIGGPNAGKSQLVQSLTRAMPQVADYPFTTRDLSPGMMPYEDVLIQLIDTPPITADVFDPNVEGFLRGADVALLLIDLGCDEGIEQLQDVLNRLQNSKTRLAVESYLHPTNVGVSFTQTFLVPNKMDVAGARDRLAMLREFYKLDFEQFPISAALGDGLEPLRDAIFRTLQVVRVYTKLPTSKEPDFDKPFTIPRGGTLLDVARLVHEDLAKNLKSARVWGSNVHDGTQVKSDYVLHDRDIVELHM